MPERLRDDPDGLSVLCAQAAAWLTERRSANVPAIVIEKDFWVTEVLRATTHSDPLFVGTAKGNRDLLVRPVFKGGTSLSKAYGLIERFSEDADVYLHAKPADPDDDPDECRPGKSRFDTIMNTTADRVGEQLAVPADSWGNPKSGWKRGYRYAYPGSSITADAGYKEGVLLELVRMGTPTPNAPHTIRSLLADFAAATGTVAAEEFDELTPFTIDVLAAERTLVDKLAILHDLGSTLAADPDNDTSRLAYQTRHYYDVHRLLANPAVRQSLQATPGIVADYAADAYEESKQANRTPVSQRPDGGYAASPAFTDEQVLNLVSIEYQAEMSRLSLGPIPEFSEVVATVHAAASTL